jgi:DNA-directed RNA polymerase subunit RPC12/RpoP
MWKCERCGEEIEDQFKSCWKCAEQEAQRTALQCPRCQAGMEYQGRKHLHEGDWIDRTHHLPVDAYVCLRCGRLELFAGNVGEALRPE